MKKIYTFCIVAKKSNILSLFLPKKFYFYRKKGFRDKEQVNDRKQISQLNFQNISIIIGSSTAKENHISSGVSKILHYIQMVRTPVTFM